MVAALIWLLNTLILLSAGAGGGCWWLMIHKGWDEAEGNRNFFFGIAGGLLVIRFVAWLLLPRHGPG
ncbi:MAG: hypothetical protein WC451_04920 [Patescibacteria group bacterium]